MNEKTELAIKIATDPAAFFPGRLNHKEMLESTQIAPETIKNWYRHKLLPADFEYNPGRGAKRKYTIEAARTLAMIGALVKHGFAIRDASMVAAKILGGFLDTKTRGGAAHVLKIALPDEWGWLLIAPDRYRTNEFTFDMINTAEDIAAYIASSRSQGRRGVIWFDHAGVFADFYRRLAEMTHQQ